MTKRDFSGIDPETGERWSARKVAKIMGLRAIHDEGEIRKVCERVVEKHPDKVEEYRKGKSKLLGFFVKGVMDETRNGADPTVTNLVLRELLDFGPFPETGSHGSECPVGYTPMSQKELDELDASIQSAKEDPKGIYLGSFSKYLDENKD